MSQKAEYVQLETGDDTTSVRDRLSFLRGQRVLLIWPEEGTTLTRKLDLVLIQREAMRLSIRLALVTHDPQVIQHANELNISTFETIGSSERGRWRRGRSRVFTTRLDRPEDETDTETLKPIATRLRDEEDEPNRWRFITRAAVLLILLGVALAVAYLVLPSATVTITPAQSIIPIAAEIVADPQVVGVDVEQRIIPAVTLRVEIEDTGTIPTTGNQPLTDSRATGTVVFINRTTDPIQVPAGTIVSSSAGRPIRFRTLDSAAVPAEAGGQVEVAIEALDESSGPIGNVETNLINTIESPLAEMLAVLNISPTFGGETRSLKAVNQEDYDRLLATLRQQLQSRAYLGMEDERNPSQMIILETIRITEEREDWKNWSARPGEAADTLTLTMRAVVEATAIDESLAQQVVFSMLNAEVRQFSSRSIVPGQIQFSCCEVLGIDATGRVAFTMTGQGVATAEINTGLLQERLAGMTPDEARQYLLSTVDLVEDTAPQIEVWPQWIGNLPLLPVRITVVKAPPA